MMIMMMLNPLMKWPPQWLTEKQVAVAEMHFERRYRAAKRALGQDDPVFFLVFFLILASGVHPCPVPGLPLVVRHEAVRFAG